MTHEVLRPLADRYAWWLNRSAALVSDTSDEEPDQVRAMPIILHIDKVNPPARTALLEAAASAAVAVCLDPKSTTDEEWHTAVAAWIAGHIRKVSRRARGVQWDAVQELPGITITRDGAQARALLPRRVVDNPREVSKLQISGSELPEDKPGPVPAGEPVLWLNPTISMSVGKAAAQVGHATMLLAAMLYADDNETEINRWADTDFRCALRTPKSAEWLASLPGNDPAKAWRDRRVVAVRDAGFTEVAPGTITVLAFSARGI